MNSLEQKQALKDFPLEEYRALQEAFWKSEEIGETRVNWFIGIVTGVVGGLAWLLAANDSAFQGEQASLIPILLGGLISLLAFGIQFTARIWSTELPRLLSVVIGT